MTQKQFDARMKDLVNAREQRALQVWADYAKAVHCLIMQKRIRRTR